MDFGVKGGGLVFPFPEKYAANIIFLWYCWRSNLVVRTRFLLLPLVGINVSPLLSNDTCAGGSTTFLLKFTTFSHLLWSSRFTGLSILHSPAVVWDQWTPSLSTVNILLGSSGMDTQWLDDKPIKCRWFCSLQWSGEADHRDPNNGPWELPLSHSQHFPELGYRCFRESLGPIVYSQS